MNFAANCHQLPPLATGKIIMVNNMSPNTEIYIFMSEKMHPTYSRVLIISLICIFSRENSNSVHFTMLQMAAIDSQKSSCRHEFFRQLPPCPPAPHLFPFLSNFHNTWPLHMYILKPYLIRWQVSLCKVTGFTICFCSTFWSYHFSGFPRFVAENKFLQDNTSFSVLLNTRSSVQSTRDSIPLRNRQK